MKEKVNQKKDIVIIGGGFIGVEFADEIRKIPNTNVTIVQILDNVLSLVCDNELCFKAEQKLKDNGVNLLTNSKVVRLSGDSEVKTVVLENGKEITADMVVIASGVVPNTKLAKNTNLNYELWLMNI